MNDLLESTITELLEDLKAKYDNDKLELIYGENIFSENDILELLYEALKKTYDDNESSSYIYFDEQQLKNIINQKYDELIDTSKEVLRKIKIHISNQFKNIHINFYEVGEQILCGFTYKNNDNENDEEGLQLEDINKFIKAKVKEYYDNEKDMEEMNNVFVDPNKQIDKIIDDYYKIWSNGHKAVYEKVGTLIKNTRIKCEIKGNYFTSEENFDYDKIDSIYYLNYNGVEHILNKDEIIGLIMNESLSINTIGIKNYDVFTDIYTMTKKMLTDFIDNYYNIIKVNMVDNIKEIFNDLPDRINELMDEIIDDCVYESEDKCYILYIKVDENDYPNVLFDGKTQLNEYDIITYINNTFYEHNAADMTKYLFNPDKQLREIFKILTKKTLNE